MVDNIKACADLCLNTSGCLFWAFRESDSHCWTKTSDSGKMGYSGLISGNKQCGKKTLQEMPILPNVILYCKTAIIVINSHSQFSEIFMQKFAS